MALPTVNFLTHQRKKQQQDGHYEKKRTPYLELRDTMHVNEASVSTSVTVSESPAPAKRALMVLPASVQQGTQ